MSFFNQHIKHDTCVCCGGYVPEGRQVCITVNKKRKNRGETRTKKIACCGVLESEGIYKIFGRSRLLMSGKIEMNKMCWGGGIYSPTTGKEKKTDMEVRIE